MQVAFFFDQSRCLACLSCEVVCKQLHDIPVGPRWRKVYERVVGTFPNVGRYSLSLSCNHCESPPCIPACRQGAIFKRAQDGIVLIDAARCDGCQECIDACPYRALVVAPDGGIQKCTACVERVTRGQAPGCVQTCPGRALHFGSLPEMAGRRGAERVVGNSQPALFLRSSELELANYELVASR
ncbi:MAG: 4Fe-4S dicluster domain-containing protein [Chloroflexi bacterium]|nr:4Fe-4S dicluster domain-containing protein [Chloroflexota bacterium]